MSIVCGVIELQFINSSFFIITVIFELVEQFTQIFVSELTNLNYDSAPGTSGHSSIATAEALSRACQHVRHQIVSV